VPLTDEERVALKKLQQKEKEPASAPVGKVINVSVDLGDEAQVQRAIKHGFLTADEAAAEGNGDGDDDDDSDDAPRRKGYFGT
jgi:hypothetical protein